MTIKVKCECDKPELLDAVWVMLDSADHHDADRGFDGKVVGYGDGEIKVAFTNILGELMTGWYENWRVSKL